MKVGGFILGGVCGIIAATYLSQKRSGGSQWAGAAGNLMSEMKDKAIGAALNRKFGNAEAGSGGTSAGISAGSSSSSSAGASKSGNQSWGTIEKILSSDPEAKKQTEEIMSESVSGKSH
jgi:hypothetical protein